jgi:dihydrofolate reductase
MAKLIYSNIQSLDGYISDEQGKFGWARPDPEVHSFVNDRFRDVGTYLYGRRLYDTMVVWETIDDEEPITRDFADIWRAADKIVYSRTLEAPSSAKTRVERDFDPEAVRALKASADSDLAVGGAELAGQAMKAGLVDELDLIVVPYIAGGGKRSLPDHLSLKLDLVEEHRFGNGTIFLNYRTA